MSTYPLCVPANACGPRSRGPVRPYSISSLPTPTPKTHASPRAPPVVQSNVLIPRLREAINSLDSKMALLMRERRELELRLEQAVRLQSPVLRLPGELLASIFVVGVLNDVDDVQEHPEEDKTAVMLPTLMLVCRHWQDVVLGTPSLWAKIAVGPLHSIEQARRKLGRSKSCPLDISIIFGLRMEHTMGVTEQVVRAMDLFRPALWRVKSFRLHVPTRPQANAVLLRCKEDAPMLEVLSIRIYHAIGEDNARAASPLPLFNGRTPRLWSCSMTSFNFGWDVGLACRLRVLRLGGYFNAHTPSTNTLLGILCESPQLEEISLRNLSDVDCAPCAGLQDFDPPPLAKVVHLPRLRKASFHYAGIALTQQLMAQFSSPNLESLDLCYLENVTPILQLLYVQALTRLPLRRLRIESSLFNELKLVSLLRRLSSLVCLELVDVEDASAGLLRGLSSPQPWVCPKLDTFVLDGCTSLDWDSLRTFVESRLPANTVSYPSHRHSLPAVSSASTAAAEHARLRALPVGRGSHSAVYLGPVRLRSIDVTRCNLSKEMMQWLQMFVSEVKCREGGWGET
ncbi:unnamed protein product [Mycena citricolor]|uniref:F-box domain-containing protein n=1 Tax=Mycena citricolor TaxID=2018698 RepID=A0AAD2Q7B9_9AGAR|nr:unnamed protein product [Mycena citricolor]